MPITNSKDVLFKSKVNNYINEKVGTTTFAVTDVGNGYYTIGKSNGDVTLTYDGQNEAYIFTPNIGDAVSVLASNVSSISVDFITLNADAITLENMNITGSGIVNLGSISTVQNLSAISPAVLMADVVGATEDEPFFLYPNDIGYPTAGRIITIQSGEVMLEEYSSNTSIIVNDDATFILRAEQASEVTINGEGSSVILGSLEGQPTSISVNTKGTNHITGGMGADTIELGKGTDILYYALGDENYSSDSSTSGYDTIKNFSVGIDKISLLSRVGTSLTALSSLERFEDIEGSSITSEQDFIDNVLKSASFLALEENKAGIVVVDCDGEYAGTYLYVNDNIAELDEDKDLFIKMLDTTDLDAVGTLNVSDYFVEAEEVFKVTNVEGAVTFSGTARGNISLSIDGEMATFTKGSITATTTVELTEETQITLALGQTLEDSAIDLNNIPIYGEGNVIVSGSVGDQTLNIWTSGINSITAGESSDKIWLGDSTANMGQDTIIIASGDSTATETDEIYFFELGVGKDILSFPSATVAGNITIGTGIIGEDITEGGATIGQMIITDGIVTFQAADDTTAVSINSTEALTAAVTYLSNEVLNGNTVAFEYDLGGGMLGTYIFQGNASEDIVVNLVGITSITNLNTAVVISEIIL